MRGRLVLAVPILLVLGYCSFEATRPDLLIDPLNRQLHLYQPKWISWYSGWIDLPRHLAANQPLSSVEDRVHEAGYAQHFESEVNADGATTRWYWKQGTSFFLDCSDFLLKLEFDPGDELISAVARKQRNRCVL